MCEIYYKKQIYGIIKNIMNPQFSKKTSEINQEKANLEPEIRKTSETTPEQERFSEKEKEDLKREVLREIEKKEQSAPPKPVSSLATKVPSAIPEPKSQLLIEIESVLEQDLEGVYFKLEPAVQQKFKVKGEETARKIEKVLQKTKVKAREIFKLIVEWLKVIPGVNRFFIRQEAKIKTNQIIKLKK